MGGREEREDSSGYGGATGRYIYIRDRDIGRAGRRGR